MKLASFLTALIIEILVLLSKDGNKHCVVNVCLFYSKNAHSMLFLVQVENPRFYSRSILREKNTTD